MLDTSSKQIERIQKEKEKEREKGDFKEVASLCNALGKIFFAKGNYEDALKEHREELFLSETTDDKIGAALGHRGIAECLCELEQYDDALHHIEQQLQLACSQNDLLEQQRAHATLGRTYLCQAEAATSVAPAKTSTCLQNAQHAFLKGLEVCQRLKGSVDDKLYQEMKARLLLNLGLVYDHQGKIRESADYIKNAIRITQKNAFYETLFRCQYSLSGMYQRNGDLSQAMRLIESACQSASKARDKVAEYDAKLQKALLFIQLKDFQAARRCLHRMYRARGRAPSEALRERLVNTLRMSARLEILQGRLADRPDDDLKSQMELVEKMGDKASELGSFQLALEFYTQMLECGQKLHMSTEALIPAYVSLSQTYLDAKKYGRAIYFYQKELDSRGENDHSQRCSTWLNIADAQEHNGEEYSVLQESYKQALIEARAASRPCLQVRVLQSLAVVKATFKDMAGQAMTEDKIRKLKSKHGIGADEEDDSQPDAVSQASDSDINLDDLSVSECSSDEEFDRGKAPLCTAKRTRTSNKAFKKNEKGETPLHRACIEGNQKRVEALLEKGHEVNPRDYCGWIPLHEAANHGFVDIVRTLLDHGAAINDRGGSQCGGVTPIHDAANCGNLEVVRLLVRRGANVHAKDNTGTTALEALREYRTRASDELTRQEIIDVHSLEKLLLNTMHGNNPHLNKSPNSSHHLSEDMPDILPYQRHKAKTQHTGVSPFIEDSEEESQITSRPARGYDLVVEDDESCDGDSEMEDIASQTDAARFHDSGTAVDVFRETISSMRSSAATRAVSQRPVSDRRSSTKGPALLAPQDAVGDDWLIDDVGPQAHKPRGSVDKLFDNNNSSRKRIHSGSGSDGRRTPVTNKRSRSSLHTAALTPANRRVSSSCDNTNRHAVQTNSEEESQQDTEPSSIDMQFVNELFQDDEDDFDVSIHEIPDLPSSSRSSNVAKKTPSSKPKQRSGTQPKLTSLGVVSYRTEPQLAPSTAPQPPAIQTSRTPPTTALAVLMKLKVKIKEKVILVPIMQSHAGETVSWLADQAADRYYQICSLRPLLTLSTPDGAALAPSDPITAVFSNNDEVEGHVETWDLPPLAVRYTDSCRTHKATMYQNIRVALQRCEHTRVLALPRLALRPLHFLPIFRALQCECLLTQLDLQGNRISDEGLRGLAGVLTSLTALTTLNLASNQITATGVRAMCDALPESASDLQQLQSVDMSYNPLGDSMAAPLVTLLQRLPALSVLQLASCHLTPALFSDQRMALTRAFRGASVTVLDMGHNALGSVGVELLMATVGSLEKLQLQGTATHADPLTGISRHLAAYLGKPGCCLRELHLGDCGLCPGDNFSQLLRCVSQSTSLQLLSLASSPLLPTSSLTQLLSLCAAAPCCTLHSVILTGRSLMSPPPTALLSALNEKLIHPGAPLQQLVVTAGADVARALEKMWEGRWDDSSCIQYRGQQLTLSVAPQ